MTTNSRTNKKDTVTRKVSARRALLQPTSEIKDKREAKALIRKLEMMKQQNDSR